MDQGGDDLANLLSDPVFVERTVTSDAFMDWNLELAINGTQLSPEQGASIFLQLYPQYIMELRQPPIPLAPPNLPLPSNLSDLWQSLVNSDWLRNNEHEPKIAGFSVLRQMLVQQPDSTNTQTLWICGAPSLSHPNAVCGQVFRRPDRATTHIRAKHLSHRPFPCGGQCGVPTWYVTPDPMLCRYSNVSKPSYSERRFTSQENVHQHCNPQVEQCEW
jgi:hypothetical protein